MVGYGFVWLKHNTTTTLRANYRPGHRGQALLSTSIRKIGSLSGDKRASPLPVKKCVAVVIIINKKEHKHA